MASKEVEPRFKEEITCPCNHADCKRWGTPKRAFTRGDFAVHIKNCPCKRCKGRNIRSGGKVGERTSRDRHRIPKLKGLGRTDEETEISKIWRSAKSGGEVKTLATNFHKHQAEQEAKRPVGNNKPFVLDAIPDPNGREVITCFSHLTQEQYDAAAIALIQMAGKSAWLAAGFEMGWIE